MSEKPKHDHDECHRILRAAHANEQSLRQQLAVTRAALAQCATALRRSRKWLDPRYGGEEMSDCNEIDIALASPDVERAVRIEAAREAVERAAQRLKDVMCAAGVGELDTSYDVTVALAGLANAIDTLTSERKP